MLQEGYQVHPKELTEEERQRLVREAEALLALRERIRQRTGTIDVASLVRRARGVEA